jgi:hypothetical protein
MTGACVRDKQRGRRRRRRTSSFLGTEPSPICWISARACPRTSDGGSTTMCEAAPSSNKKEPSPASGFDDGDGGGRKLAVAVEMSLLKKLMAPGGGGRRSSVRRSEVRRRDRKGTGTETLGGDRRTRTREVGGVERGRGHSRGYWQEGRPAHGHGQRVPSLDVSFLGRSGHHDNHRNQVLYWTGRQGRSGTEQRSCMKKKGNMEIYRKSEEG